MLILSTFLYGTACSFLNIILVLVITVVENSGLTLSSASAPEGSNVVFLYKIKL